MKKKIIALADNSYTIRRIVELSFSEIENVEVHSFENGAGLKDKLLRLEPDVVVVDIKLPETSGYDVCRFINETPTLKHSRVFLMKGSFEAVDNEMIKNLKYEDIVTKPFDSNALVAMVMKNLGHDEQKAAADFPDEEPSSFPEDIMEIEPETASGEGINFADIRLDLNAPASAGGGSPQGQAVERDEILPSEEITQGTQPAKDALQPPDEDAIQNPFKEEPIADEVKFNVEDMGAAPMSRPDQAADAAVGSSFRDISDEFHDRFQKVGAEDTADSLAKASLESTRMAERKDFKFAIDREDELFSAVAKDATKPLTDFGAGAPKKPLYTEKDEIFDFGPASQKPGKEKGAEARAEKLASEELFVQKVRPEVLSPEAELKKLTPTPPREREVKSEPRTDSSLTANEKLDLSGKLEDRLSLTIKELIWEIMPSLAEKIIKEEIEKIKAETNKTDF